MRVGKWRILISPREFPVDTVRDAMNAHLRPQPIAVLDAELRRLPIFMRGFPPISRAVMNIAFSAAVLRRRSMPGGFGMPGGDWIQTPCGKARGC